MSRITEVKEVRVMPGTEIEDAILEAVAFSTKNDCFVKFEFNGIELMVSKYDTVHSILDVWDEKTRHRWEREQKEND